MREDKKSRLKLNGKNLEDLNVISAYCQDSIVAIKDIAYLKQNKIFAMIISRFMWEDIEKGLFRKNKRIKSVIKFSEVLKVKSKKINQKKVKSKLEFLAIECNKVLNKNYEINIFFAGGSAITLISEVIDVVLDDLGASWEVKYVPKHKI
tara:strand:- start:32 stop:481 length:450 start_codon:yes stop_codon:yes gene_type:complete